MISLSATAGLLNELQLVLERAINKAILLFPPVGAHEVAVRWDAARQVLPNLDSILPADPEHVVAAVTHDGRIVAIAADQPDEAVDRAALAMALD